MSLRKVYIKGNCAGLGREKIKAQRQGHTKNRRRIAPVFRMTYSAADSAEGGVSSAGLDSGLG